MAGRGDVLNYRAIGQPESRTKAVTLRTVPDRDGSEVSRARDVEQVRNLATAANTELLQEKRNLSSNGRCRKSVAAGDPKRTGQATTRDATGHAQRRDQTLGSPS
jgi:hypothetical protein